MDYFEKLRNIGFEVEEILYASKLRTEEIEKYRIVTNEIIPLCKKIQ